MLIKLCFSRQRIGSGARFHSLERFSNDNARLRQRRTHNVENAVAL